MVIVRLFLFVLDLFPLYLSASTCCPAWLLCFFFLRIRRPPRSTLDRSSAASDVYKRQVHITSIGISKRSARRRWMAIAHGACTGVPNGVRTVSYTHLRAHETVLDLVCRLLLAKTNHTRILTRVYSHASLLDSQHSTKYTSNINT